MVPLTNEELRQLCEYLSTASYIYYPVATDFFRDLYKTGCRPNELLQVERWNYISDSEIILTPLKDNLPRAFIAADLSPSLLFAIQNNIKPYQSLTSVMKKILPLVKIQTIDKSAIDYMFRYNKVKTLKDQGESDSEIQSRFGWTNALLPSLYGARIVYRIGELPPFGGNYLVDYDGTRITDNEGNLLVYQ
jgi:hypothetical protein